MRFLKEYVIIFLIIVFVISIEIITDSITYKSINDINSNIQEVEQSIETDEATTKINDLYLSWKRECDKLSFYMEHDELEKVGVLVNNVKSDIENKNTEDVKQELDEIKFLLDHVKDKQRLQLKSIF